MKEMIFYYISFPSIGSIEEMGYDRNSSYIYKKK